MTNKAKTGVETAIARNAASYDDFPYVSHPFPQTHPGRLAAAARIFKLKPSELKNARVLELGCASGGNLIPLAARYPEATFVGVDLSKRQTDEAKRRIEANKLTNIDIRCESITDFSDNKASFDYIICHGVYSWVPEPVRAAILKIIGEYLKPFGVAIVSYNVLPGWRLRQTLRDALSLHAGTEGSLQQRVTRAREMISFLEEHTAEETAWGRIFRNEAAGLRNSEDYYIGHEFLEDCNEPCSFTDFMKSATNNSLGYLGDTDLAVMFPENMHPKAAPFLRQLAGENQVDLEQRIDIFTGRTFRQSLLVHKEREGQIKRLLSHDAIDGMHFLARPDFKFLREENGVAIFGDGSGAWFSTPDKQTRKALEALVARLPGSSSLDDLLSDLKSSAVMVDAAVKNNITDAFYRMALVGLLKASTEPVRAATRLSAKPVACPLLRADAEAGVVYSASLRHEPFKLDIVEQIVTPLLDGKHNRDDLIKATLEAHEAGRVTFNLNNEKVTEKDAVATQAAQHVDRVLSALLSNGCLIS